MSRIAAFFLGVSLVLLPLGYWSLDRDPPFELRKSEIITEKVAPGGYVNFRVFARRFRPCPVTVETQVYDGEGKRWVLPDQRYEGLATLGDVPPYVNSIFISPEAAPGRGRIEIILAYQCNLAHRWNPIVVKGSVVEFDIVKP